MIEPKIIQACTGLQIKDAINGQSTGIIFNTAYGPILISMDGSQLSLLIAMIINNANGRAPEKKGTETVALRFDPIETKSMGVAPGPTQDKVYVSMLMGEINMTFVVNKAALQSACVTLAREIR